MNLRIRSKGPAVQHVAAAVHPCLPLTWGIAAHASVLFESGCSITTQLLQGHAREEEVGIVVNTSESKKNFLFVKMYKNNFPEKDNKLQSCLFYC